MKSMTIEDQANQILEKPYQRRLIKESDGGYSASIFEFPGCFAEGNNADEALENLNKAAASWITVSLSNGQTINDPISFDGVSGRIALRIPRGLHQQIYEMAYAEDCSVNQLLTAAISEYVGRKHTVKLLHSAIWRQLHEMQRMYVTSGGWSAHRLSNFEAVMLSTQKTNFVTNQSPPLDYITP